MESNTFDSEIEKIAKENKNLKPRDEQKPARKQNKFAELQHAKAVCNASRQKIRTDANHLYLYLDLQARFQKMYVNNVLILAEEKPSATYLQTYDEWNEKGVYIKRGEKAIILREVADPAENGGENGIKSFVPVPEFDISQTSAMQTSPNIVTYDHKLIAFSLLKNLPCDVELVKSDDQAATVTDKQNARYNAEKNTMYIRKGQTPEELFPALARERALLEYSGGERTEQSVFISRCAAYMLCVRYRMPAESEKVVTEMPEYFKKLGNKEVTEELGKIRRLANEMSAKVRDFAERNAEIREQKEQSVQKSADERSER